MTPPSYKIVVDRVAAKAIRSLDKPNLKRVSAAIDKLATDPRPHGCVPVKSRPGCLRIRVGDYRIVYRVTDAALEVLVVAVGHRSDIYD